MNIRSASKNIRDLFLSRLFHRKFTLRRTKLAWGAVAVFVVTVAIAGIIHIFLPINPDDANSVLFKVQEGEGSYRIASDLEEAGLIRSRTSFFLYAVLTGRALRFAILRRNLKNADSLRKKNSSRLPDTPALTTEKKPISPAQRTFLANSSFCVINRLP
ncbi:MAG: hypothetical protein UY53_C0010G0039 [Parcubacteria group bacterium GW2011_GWA2_50_10]|nr:MAG: hypothetical protein UY53_C0010G0039 [Parcubacteria group bacterium GW2011_GWA2_50_10]